MPKPADAIHLDPARQSPQLPALVATAQEIDGVTYPAAADVDSAAVVEDWLLHVEDALIEARNGVTAISWPLALAGLVGFLALLADVADGAPSILQAVVASPWKSLVCAALLVATIVAFRLSDEPTEKRRKLVAIRSAYFRRRRELVEGQLASSSDDAHLVPGDRGVPKADGGVASTHEGR